MASRRIECLILSGSRHVSRAVELFLERENEISSQINITDRKGLTLMGQGDFYDCIILDLSMLDVNKPEAVQSLKRTGRCDTIIVIDTDCNQTLVEVLRSAGADECIDLQSVGSKLVGRIIELNRNNPEEPTIPD